ncbi:MAG: Ni/Fe hydrogenase subunit alpha [Actinobacteria bacterium]|nr:Ni/Fe hydrogenase subunit alpha [Actinomycetota bacterium]
MPGRPRPAPGRDRVAAPGLGAAAADDARVHRVQAPRLRLRRRGARRAVPWPRHPHRLRGPVSGVRPRVLRVLRPLPAPEHRGARAPVPGARDVAGPGGGEVPVHHRVRAGIPRDGREARAGGGERDVTHRSVEVPVIARVEGEGALHLRLEDGEIADLRLEIYEPPRFFESFLRGRHFSEVPDIVPRICGICPVAYQMSAVHGLEQLFEVQVPAGTRELRRLLYFGEWIESHVLHVFLLAAPDFLGYHDAIEMAAHEPELVKKALGIKRVGNDLMAAIGGREIHPVSPRVGGFSKAPRRLDLDPFLSRLEDALAELPGIADFAAGLERPSLPRPAEMVALVHPDEYAINEGGLASTDGRAFDATTFEAETREEHVAHSNALHSVMADSGEPYFVGPLARVNLNEERLTPVARECAARLGLHAPEPDPFLSMAARVVETALAIEESIRLIRGYEPPEPPCAEVSPRPGRAMWVTEAPRGILYHRYDVAGDGTIVEAKIVPPTAQNLRHMEADLRTFVPGVLDRSDEELQRLCEMVVRNYDPCISCATHFLRLEIERT